jgi:hypothetical protein
MWSSGLVLHERATLNATLPTTWLGGLPQTHLHDRIVWVLEKDNIPLWQAAVWFGARAPISRGMLWNQAGVVLIGGEEHIYVLDMVLGETQTLFALRSPWRDFALPADEQQLFVLGIHELTAWSLKLHVDWCQAAVPQECLAIHHIQEGIVWVHTRALPDKTDHPLEQSELMAYCRWRGTHVQVPPSPYRQSMTERSLPHEPENSEFD